jgi:hypothetical protein
MPDPQPSFCTFLEDFVQEARDTASRRTAAVQTREWFNCGRDGVSIGP